MKLWVLLLTLAAVACAQEYRATLLGIVTDSSGAAIADARIEAINVETGVATAAVTGNEGSYLIPFLTPGKYSVRVEHPGFKSLQRGPIELRVNDRARLDLPLEVGQISDRVTVTAEAELLEVSSASRGQVVENRKITDLPLNSKNPFTLMNLASGVQYTGSMLYFRPFDNGAIADFSINGGRSGANEFQIDGVSDNANTGRSNLAYVPPVEATQEFKIQTNTYDSQYGRTGGGVISLHQARDQHLPWRGLRIYAAHQPGSRTSTPTTPADSRAPTG
jgi:TonB-dependent Receptor Plug Domain.